MLTATKKSVKAGKFVNTQHVDTLIKNYKQTRWAANSERIGKEDSLSVWYSIEEIEEFLAVAKANNADGVKMFFGAYSPDYTEAEGYAERQTLVMVATKQSSTGQGIANKNVYINTDKGTNVLAYNCGRLCPPNCMKPVEEIGFDEIGITIVDRGQNGMVIV